MSNYWKIPGIPHKGWELQGVIDLGEDGHYLSENNYETCMMCANENIRYIHLVTHDEMADEFRVGCVCAEKMTGDYTNPKRMETNLHNRATRRTNWANANWQWEPERESLFEKRGHVLAIFRDKRSNQYKCMMDDEFGTVLHKNIPAAKEALFKKMEHMKEREEW